MIKVARSLEVGKNHPITVLEEVEPSYQKGVWALITDDDAYCVVHAPSGMVVPNYADGGQHFYNYEQATSLVDQFYNVIPDIASDAQSGAVPDELSPQASNYTALLAMIKK